MRFLNKMKSVMLVAASLFCFSSVFAESKTFLLHGKNMTVGTDAEGYSIMTGNEGTDAEGVVLTLLNSAKSWSTHNSITVDGASLATIKVSNGAQNSCALPEGYVATKVTLYSYININTAKKEENIAAEKYLPNGYRTSYWKEFAGVSYSAPEMNVFIDGDLTAPDAISFDLDKVSSFTFTNTGEQACFVMKIEAETAGAAAPATPTLSNASVVFEAAENLADADTLRFTFTVDCAEGETVYVAGTQADMMCWALVGYGMQGQMYMPGEIYPAGVSMENPVLAVTKGTHTVAIPVAKTVDAYGMYTFERVATPATTWGIVLVSAEMEIIGAPVEGTVDIPAAPSALEFATTGYTWVDVAGTDADTLIVTATIKVNDPSISADSTFYVIPYSGGDQTWIGSLDGINEEGKRSWFFNAAPANLVNGGIAAKAGDVEIKIIVPKTMEYNNKIYTRMATEDELVLALATMKLVYNDWTEEYTSQADKMIPAAPITVNIPAYVPAAATPTLSDVTVAFEAAENLADADTLRFTFTVDCAEGETVYVAGTQADMMCWALVGYGMQGQMYMPGEIYPAGVSMENPVLEVTKGTHTVAIPVAKTVDAYGMYTFERVATPGTTWGIVLVSAEMELIGTPVEGTVDIPAAPSALEFATTGYTWVDVAGTDADTLIVTATVKVNDPTIAADSTFYIIPYSGGDQTWIGSLDGVDEEGKRSWFFNAAPANLVSGGVAVKAGDVEIKIIVPKTMEYNNKIYTRMATEDELVLALATMKLVYNDWTEEYTNQADKMIPAAPITVNIPAYVPAVEEEEDNMMVVKSWDFASIADTMSVTDSYVTYSEETVKVGGTDSNLGTEYYAGLAFQGANKFYIRTKTGGLYQGNGGGRKVGVLDLVPGQVVTIVTDSECMSLADATTAEQASVETVDGKTTYVYNITAEGMLALTMTRYFNIFSIEVKQQVAYMTASEWNFAAMTAAQTEEKVTMTFSTETVKVGGTASNLGTDAYAGLAMQGADKFFTYTKTGGLYSGNGGGRKVGVLDLTAGSIVTVVTDGECMALADASNAVEASKETVDGKTTYVYNMTGDGILALTMTRYFSIFSIKVEKLVKYVAAPNWDFAAMTAAQTEEKVTMTFSTETVKVGGTASNLGTDAYAGLAMQGADKFFTYTKTGGLYSNNGGGRKVGVLDLTAGSIVTVVTDGECMALADASNAVEASKETVDGKTTYVYNMTGDGILALTMTRYFTIYSINVLAVQADIKVPTITLAGNTYDVMTVTLACDTKNASVYYTIDGGETTLYTEPFQMIKSGKVVAWSATEKATSKAVEKDVTAGYIPVPTATVTAVSNETRTVTLATTIEGATIVYATTEGAELAAYTEPFVISDTTTVYAVASRVSTVADTLTFASDTLTSTLAAGTILELAAPTFAKVSVDSATDVEYAEKNLAAIVLKADQSSVLCKPTATIAYEFYALNAETGRVSEAADLSGAYTDTLKALPLGLLKATASAEGYASSEAHMWLKAPANLQEVWKVNFEELAATIAASGDLSPVYTDVVFNGNFRANATSDFSNITFGEEVINPGFVLQTGTTWYLRNQAGGKAEQTGLYNGNSGDRAFGVAGLKKNQVVKVLFQDASQVTYFGGNIEQDMANSNGNELCYKATADGNVTIAMNRYYYVYSVGVYDDPSVTANPDLAVSKVDGVNRYISMETRTLGADVYYAIGTEEYADITEVKIDTTLVNDTVGGVAPEFKYDTTLVKLGVDTTIVYGEYALYTEPIHITATTHFAAYATYQDVNSEVVYATFETGTTVQVNKPVITYVGAVEGGKQFSITVDNSDVLSTPTTPIYYTLPGGEKTLYTEPITVANGVYGWLTATAELEGYETSATASRYVDARETYNEVYEALRTTDTAMPAEAADIEFEDGVNLTQEAALTPSGNIYFHRTMHAGYNAVVLPFAMTTANLENGTVKVTDATGKSLVRGTDYTVHRVQATTDFANAETLLAEGKLLHTANLVGNTAAYLIEVAEQYVGQDLIFVSAPKQTIALTQNSFDALADAGKFKVVINKRFQTVTAEVPVYTVNAKGTKLVKQAAGAVIPAYTFAVIADSAFTADNADIRLIDTSFKFEYKDMAQDTIFLTTPENMLQANAEKWARTADENAGWNNFSNVTNKKGTIDPITGEECASTVFPGVMLKNNAPKTVVLYVTNVASFKAYVVSTGGSDRTATCTATDSEGNVTTGSVLSPSYTSAVLEMNLEPAKCYELKFTADADVLLYGINFKSGGLGIEGIEVELEENGIIYDMTGRRVQKLMKGQMYIQNGVKFVIE